MISAAYLVITVGGMIKFLINNKSYRERKTIPAKAKREETFLNFHLGQRDEDYIPILNREQIDSLMKENIVNCKDARTIAINEAFLSGKPVCANMEPDGKWKFEKVEK
ncbi:MAG TPA: hypothetical protein VMX17_07945 [Candidatus Glassbacteria bacterium]|nr:hypothetical protein [Candidatus Glassbacteria bacterium]